MYLGLFFVLLGWGYRLGHVVNGLLLVSFLFSMTYLQIKPEEQVLEDKFGEDYRRYKQATRRWL